MAAHVASAAIRRHQQETKSHKAQSHLLHQNDHTGVECEVACENGVFVSVPLGSGNLGSISEIPDEETDAFKPHLSNENHAFAPVSSSTPLKGMYSMTAESCNEARFYGQSSSTCSTDTESTSSPSGETPFSATSSITSSSDGPQFIAPILGYEILEQRARFTVFKIHVQHVETQDSWFVFRRYTDFARLNRKLRGLFPTIRFPLPPKRWFKDNFDPTFLDERVLGLQTFVNRLLSHKEICQSHHVRDFFCFDDPPGPDDCLEESRLRCETLEDTVAALRLELTGKQAEIDAIRAELALTKAQREMLLKSLRMEHSIAIGNSANGKDAANKNEAISSISQALSGSQFHSEKSQLDRETMGNNSILSDSCDDSYTTANHCSDIDGSSRCSRETLIEKSVESTFGHELIGGNQSFELSKQPKDIRNEFKPSNVNQESKKAYCSNNAHLPNSSYANGSSPTMPATTDDNGNQTFAKTVGLRQ